jgi:RNA polymerase sigma factor (TIGR02999 family)
MRQRRSKPANPCRRNLGGLLSCVKILGNPKLVCLAVLNMKAHKPSPPEVTKLLQAWSKGDQSAFEQLVPLIEAEIHRIARRYMLREAHDCQIQTTMLIDDVYLRLIAGETVQWQNRAHFFAVCARAMRQVLVSYARNRHAGKRGGGVIMVVLEEALTVAQKRGEDVIKLDEALTTLAALSQRQSQIVELKFFGGLETREIAEFLKVPPRTIERDWRIARAWLRRELS